MDSYLEYVLSYRSFLLTANFNPNDGVNTTHILNWKENWTPNYLLVVDENGKISSRWFVLKQTRTRNGQYNVDLRRDVLVDYYDSILKSPVYVEKGNIGVENPLIYNSENVLLNQIKVSEEVLKDITGTAWIVGYIANNGITQDLEIRAIPKANGVNISSLAMQLIDPNNPQAGAKINIAKTSRIYNYFLTGLTYRALRFTYNNGNISDVIYYNNAVGADGYSFKANNFSIVLDRVVDRYKSLCNYFSNDIQTAISTLLQGENIELASPSELEDIKKLNGQIIYSDITQKFYKMTLSNVYVDKTKKISFNFNEATQTQLQLASILDSMTNSICEIAEGNYAYLEKEYSGKPFEYIIDLSTINVSLSEIHTSDELIAIIKPSHNKLNDAPYSMFALPYNDENLSLSYKLAEALGGTSNFLYDMQILPYCPAIENISMVGEGEPFPALGTNEDTDFNYIKDGEGNIISFILWCKNSSNTFIIDKRMNIDSGDAVEIKAINQCDVYRLVSPNYNGAFEFNLAKNGGVDYFEVAYTYKPFSPYIIVNPAFNNLYGTDFDDARGLICNGDFSVATITDQWINYQINNKNYENIFNAQIKTMDRNNELNLLSQSVSSPIQAVATGVGVGSLLGNPAVGVASGVASLAGGIADIAIGQSVYQNNRRLQRDLFDLNLRNVMARPDTLNKVSAFNINNKYFPFIEKYTCSEKEREAFKNKIKYEGMTVGAIGTMEEYLDDSNKFNYFKGKLIIHLSEESDFFISDTIAVELEKGVYI